MEQGLTHKHERDHSFDSASLVITEIQDDSIFYCNTNNTTMVSDDLMLSPRKYYSMRGRPRYLPPATDIRKAKKSHSWHNLRYKHFKRSTSRLSSTRADTTQMTGDTITTVTDTTTSFNGFDPTQSMENNRASPTLIDVSTELYQNIATGDVELDDRASPTLIEISTELYQNIATGDVELDDKVGSPLGVEDNSDLLEEATSQYYGSRSMLTRPSLDLSEGHVMGMTLGYETGDLPLEENKPHPFLHERSFTGLPTGEDVNQRRSVFQETPDRNDDSDPQVFVILNNAVTQPEIINDVMTPLEPTNDAVTPLEPANDAVTPLELINDVMTPLEPTNDAVTQLELINDVMTPLEPANDAVIQPEPTNDTTETQNTDFTE